MSESMKSPKATTFYVEVLVRLLQDAAKTVGLSGSDMRRDTEYLTHRALHEGLAFFTKALPKMGKALDLMLSKDYSLSHLAVECLFMDGNFHTDKRGVPTFLNGLWVTIVDRSGEVHGFHDNPVVQEKREAAVRAIRQICYLLYKLELPPTEEQQASAVEKFIATDASLEGLSYESLSSETRTALERARLLLLAVLQGFNPLDIVPAHGPGAVATGEKPWEKMKFSRYYPELDEKYSYPDYFYFNYNHLVAYSLHSLESMTDSEPVSKLALVPKDSRGPRSISMEPLEIQWIQQGLGRALVNHIEHYPTTRGFVNFTSQQINRDMASLASLGLMFETLDMEDASDRVSLWLVEQIFPICLVSYLKACRSVATQLPSGNRFYLRKFAPMGSALCFPIEALTFWALAVGTLQDVRRFKDMKSLPSVYVYGDDIIAPTGSYERLRPVFEELRLKFNDHKCCTGRFFRESCGFDAYLGKNVAPTRFKHCWTESLSPAAALAYVAYTNTLRAKGYTHTADFLQSECMRVLGPIPFTNVEGRFALAFERCDLEEHEILGHNLAHFRRRYNKSLQRVELRVPSVSTRVFKRGKPGWAEMLRLHHTWGSSSPFGGGEGVPSACRYTVPRSEKRGVCWVDSLEFIQ